MPQQKKAVGRGAQVELLRRAAQHQGTLNLGVQQPDKGLAASAVNLRNQRLDQLTVCVGGLDQYIVAGLYLR